MDELKAHLKVTEEGRKVLFYVEPDGDGAMIHMIVWVRGVGQADMKMTFHDADDAYKAWDQMVSNAFADATHAVISTLNELEAL